MTLQLLVFPHGPADQNPVQDPAGRLERRCGGLPIVVYPSTQARMAHAGELVERLITPEVPPPAADRLPHRFGSPGTDRGGEGETGLPPAMLRPSRPTRLSKKVKAIVREGTTSIRILAGHDVGRVRRPCQLARGQPGRAAGLPPARVRFTLTRRAASSGRALAGDGRLCPLPPGIERIMQEAMGEAGAETAPLRPPLSPLDEGAILAWHGGLEPPCHIPEAPWTGRVLPERPQPQRRIHGVKESCDGESQDLGVPPASLPSATEGLSCRLARSVALGVRGKMGRKDRLQSHRNHRLRKTIGHGRTASPPLTTATLGDRHRPPRGRKVTPRRQAIPERREVMRQMALAVRACLRIAPRRTLIRLDPFIGLPHHPLGNHARLCCLHWFLPSLVAQRMSAERSTPFAPPLFQGLPHDYGVFRPGAPLRDSDACGAATRVSPLTARRQGPTFPTQAGITVPPSLCRTPLRQEAGRSCTLPGGTTGSSCDVVPTLSTPPPWFACARLRDPSLTRSCRAVASPLTTLTLHQRRVRGFAASSCKAAARGRPSSWVQQGGLRVLTSYTLLRAVVAHSHRQNAGENTDPACGVAPL